MKALFLFLAGLALVAALFCSFACSDGGGEGTQSGGEEQPAAPSLVATAEPTAAEVAAAEEGFEVTVVATNDYSFEPAEIELKAGETVTLVLDSSKTFESHSLVIDELDGVNLEADGGIVASTEITPLEPGTYTFYCSVAGHREEGMEGTLTVVE
jgi:plastocyanin